MKKSVISNVAWVFVILTAVTIFYFSSLTFPVSIGVRPPGILTILYHFFAFFWLAFFLLFALVKIEKSRKSFIFIAIAIAMVYGALDEFHQLFVPGRACAFADFLVDSAGILMASLIYASSLKFNLFLQRNS